MKKLPTALTVPSSSFRVWLTIAPPLEASAPALGRLRVGRRAGRCRRRRIRRLRGGIAEVEIAGVDAVLLEEGFDVDELRLDRVAQHGGLLRDGGAAEKDHARQQAGEHQADDRQPQRMRQPDDAAEQFGHGVERDAEQHAGEDQEQRRGEIPGEQQQRGEQHDADAADRDRPGQIVAGLQPIVSRNCHVDSSLLRSCAHSFAKRGPGSSRDDGRAGLTIRPADRPAASGRTAGAWRSRRIRNRPARENSNAADAEQHVDPAPLAQA